jgi:hypothetical protein
MIVRDNGDVWQIVLQTDHAALSGEFAANWGNEQFEEVRPRRAVLAAAARHDDGWAIWERAPSLLSENGTIKPRNFLDVQVLSHLAFYRAQIAAVSDDDPYAGMLVSMHGCGIYNGRYGTDPVLRLTFAEVERNAVDAFVREQEAQQQRLVTEHGIPDEERWTNYRLLQIFDRLSLYFCMKDVIAGESDELAHTPTSYGGPEVSLRIEPTGPWGVRIAPFPFSKSPASFTVLRRELPKRGWQDVDDFRRDFFACTPEETRITIESAGEGY